MKRTSKEFLRCCQFLFLTTIFISLQLTLNAQSGVEINYPQNSQNVTVCGSGSDIFLQLQVIQLDGVDDPFKTTVAFPPGIVYIPGTLQVLNVNPAGISISESDLTDLSRPEFSISRNGGLKIGNTIGFKISRRAIDCTYYDPNGISSMGSALKDTIIVETSSGISVDDDNTINAYQARNGILSIPVESSIILTPFTEYTRYFTITNGGLECVGNFEVEINQNSNINHIGLSLGGNVILPQHSTGNIYNFSINSDLIPGGCLAPGESLVFAELIELNTCFTGTIHSNYTTRWGCGGDLCQSFSRQLPYQSDLGTLSLSFTDEVLQEGTFCSPARIRRTFINNSTAPSGLRDLIDLIATIRIASVAPVTLSNFEIEGIFLPVITDESGGFRNYRINLSQQNWPGMGDSDGDGFNDDLMSGQSISIDFDITRSCLETGCPSTFPRSNLSSQLNYVSACSILAGSSSRTTTDLTSPAVWFSSDMATNGVDAPPILINGQSGESVRIFHSRRFENTYFEQCDGNVSITIDLAPNLSVDGDYASVNGVEVPVTVTGNTVTISGFAVFADNFATIILDIPIKNNCPWAGGDVASPYTITHTCHEGCCEEIWACESIRPILTLCSGGNCDISVSEIQRHTSYRKNYGYTDVFGEMSVNPEIIPAYSRNTVIAGDTITISNLTRIGGYDAGEITLTIDMHPIEGTEVLTFTEEGSFLRYFPPSGGSPIDCPITNGAFTRVVNGDGSFTYFIRIHDLAGEGCLPADFVYEAESSVEINANFIIAEVPLHPVNFPLGLNTVAYLGLVEVVSAQDPDIRSICGGIYTFSYYKYQVEIRSVYNSINPVSDCDTTIRTNDYRIFVNGTRQNVFPGEIRPLFHLNEINFASAGFRWVDDSVQIFRYGGDGGILNSDIIAADMISGNNQTYYFAGNPWFLSDDLGSTSVGSPAVNGTLHYILRKKFYNICQESGSYSVHINFNYKLYDNGTALSYSNNNTINIVPNNSNPVFDGTSTIAMPGLNEVQSWRLIYNATATGTGRFGDHVYIALDTTVSNGIRILGVREVTSSGAPILTSNISTEAWERGIVANITGGADTGRRYFMIDYRYTTCEPDTVFTLFGKGCEGFPSDPTMGICGTDRRILTVNPEIAELQFVILDQPNEFIDLCEPLTYKFLYNSALQGNVHNPVLRIELMEGIDLSTLVLNGRYPNNISTPFEDLEYTVEGNYLMVNLNQLNNLNPTIGLPGLRTYPSNIDMRQILIEFSIITNCEFTSSSSFEIISEGENSCGSKVIGNGNTRSTNIVRSSAGSDYNYVLLPSPDPVQLNNCMDVASVNFNIVLLGTESTKAGDALLIALPEGTSCIFSSYHCNTDECPVFVLDTLIESQQVLQFILTESYEPGTLISFGFDVVIELENLVCSDSLDLAIEVISKISNVTCISEPSGECEEINDIKLLSSFHIQARLPELTIENVDYDIENGAMFISGSVMNTGELLGVSDSLRISFYCADSDGNAIGDTVKVLTIYGPLEEGESIVFNTSLESDCIFINGVVIAAEQFDQNNNPMNCICSDVYSFLPLQEEIICALPLTVDCTRDIPLAYQSAAAFVADGGIIVGYCQPIEELIITLVSEEMIDLGCGNTMTRTYRIIDNCGNENLCSQEIYITYSEDLAFVGMLPIDMMFNCEDSIMLPELLVENGCGSVEVSYTQFITDGDCPNSYTLTRTWLAMDECGNEVVHVQVVTVEDTTSPVFVEDLPADITVDCDTVPEADVLTAIDNCTSVQEVLYSEDRTDGDCPNSYTLTRTWLAMDECGNEAVHVQVVAVGDMTSPVFVEDLPADITVDCDTIPEADVLTAIDNCTSVQEVLYSEDRTDGDCPNSYTLTRTWLAMDECGNEAVHVQVVAVGDMTSPVFVEDLPADITVDCDTIPEADVLTAIDNCTSVQEVLYSEDRTDGDCPNSYTLTRTWLAMDECGNEAVHVQVVTVEDTTSPVFVEDLPADITVDCDTVPEADVLTAIDNCTSVQEVLYSEDRTDGDCPNSYTLTRTWLAIDECGNEAVHVQVVTVEDTIAPEIIINNPVFMNAYTGEIIEIECEANLDNWELPLLMEGDIEVIDNCGETEIEFTCEIEVSESCKESGYLIEQRYTIKASDECGNNKVLNIIARLVDTTAPEIKGVPADITVDCSTIPVRPELGDCKNGLQREVYVEDGCECATLHYEEEKVNVLCENNYDLIRRWIAEDNCGNTSIAEQKISVRDEKGPELIILHPDLADIANGSIIEVECRGGDLPDWIYELTAEIIVGIDGCSGESKVEFKKELDTTSGYDCARNGYIGQWYYSWSFEDECGNIDRYAITLRMIDKEGPRIAGPAVICQSDPALSELIIQDLCGIVAGVEYEDKVLESKCGNPRILRTWFAIDGCNNMSFFEQIIEADLSSSIEINPEKTVDGIVVEDGMTISLECGQEHHVEWYKKLVMTAKSECVENVEVILNEIEEQISDCVNGISRRIVLRWVAEDQCGNEADFKINFEFIDNVAPKFYGNNREVNIGCGEEAEIPVAYDNCSEVIVELVRQDTLLQINCKNDLKLLQHYAARDKCGNSTEFLRQVNYYDTEGPQFIGTPEVVCASELTRPEVSDGCGDIVLLRYEDRISSGNCNLYDSYDRHWMAEDACGNVTVFVQRVITGNLETELIIKNDLLGEIREGGVYILECSEMKGKDIRELMQKATIKMEGGCSEVAELEVNITLLGQENCLETGILGVYEVEYLVRSICNNEKRIKIMVRLADTEGPKFVYAPENKTVGCIQEGTFEEPVIEEMCSSYRVEYKEEVREIGGVTGYKVYRRTWIATDECGNVSTHQQRIEVDQQGLDAEIVLLNVPACNSGMNSATVYVNYNGGGLKFEWTVVNGECEIVGGWNTQTIQYRIGYSPVRLRVKITDKEGCITVREITFKCERIKLELRGEEDNKEALGEFIIYPNPARSNVRLEWKAVESALMDLKITDVKGRVFKKKTVDQQVGFNISEFEISDLPDGIYILLLADENNLRYEKFVKVK